MKILLIAGEHSGDQLGAGLIHALKARQPEVVCLGAGGHRMQAAGQRQVVDLVKHGVVGVLEVLRHLPFLVGAMNKLLRECELEQPDAIVLIDYPGFNLRFLRKVRALLPNALIFYYVSPQLWAWKSERAAILQKHVDLLLCIFPFEPDWYRENAPRLKTAWVGHPIMDRLFLPESNARPEEFVQIGLLPGSRQREIERHLPLLLDAAQFMTTGRVPVRFVVTAPDLEMAALEQSIIDQRVGMALDVQVRAGYSATFLSRCHMALVASGTATIEAAVAGTPMIVFYKVNLLTYLLGKLLIKVPYLCMVNLLLNKPAVPELVQTVATPRQLARTALELLASDARRRVQQEDLQKVVDLLGEPGASSNAAELILQHLGMAGVTAPKA